MWLLAYIILDCDTRWVTKITQRNTDRTTFNSHFIHLQLKASTSTLFSVAFLSTLNNGLENETQTEQTQVQFDKRIDKLLKTRF